MRSFRGDRRGLSEIVGTLMLIVIVISAATLLAAFVATYQKQEQTEAAFAHDQSLESIHVLSLSTAVANGAFTNLSFLVASEYINPSIVLGITIDNSPLLSYSVENVSNPGTWYTETLGGANLVLAPEQEILVATHLPGNPGAMGFLSPSVVPLPDQYIKIDVDTVLQNDFSRVFLPPDPLDVVSQTDATPGNNVTLLDATTSFQPGGNASIVSWSWTVTGGGTTSQTGSLTSPVAGSLSAGAFTGTGTAEFEVPGNFVYAGADAVEFTAPPAVTSGCDLTTPAEVTSSSGTVSAGVLTVTFDYSATAEAGCAGGTISIPNGGMTLLATDGFTGETVQISPALQYLTDVDVGAPYEITLTVTSSDGLEGTSTQSYTPPGSAPW